MILFTTENCNIKFGLETIFTMCLWVTMWVLLYMHVLIYIQFVAHWTVWTQTEKKENVCMYIQWKNNTIERQQLSWSQMS